MYTGKMYVGHLNRSRHGFSAASVFLSLMIFAAIICSIYIKYSVGELTKDQVEMLKKTFDMFDRDRKGYIDTNMVPTIFEALGHPVEKRDLEELIEKIDQDGNGKLDFDEFVVLTQDYLEDEDSEDLHDEILEEFRMHDKEGNGYISLSDLREILRALDDKLTEDELDAMIAEIDTDGSGTVDLNEYVEIVTGD